jgi:predicted nuclease with TOPRIM domain
MSEDLTQNLPSRSFEERVLSELAAIRGTLSQLDARLTSLEETVDARLHDTRPMWEAVQERLAGVEKELNSNNRHLKSFAAEFVFVRNRVEHLENDVEDLARNRS